MVNITEVFNLENPAFSCLIFCSAALILKLFYVALMTSRTRSRTNAFANPEDASYFGTGNVHSDPKVERLRRIHLNDLENIPAFILMGIFYLFVVPNPVTAIWHFRIFTISRFLHTIIYQLAIPQPSRAFVYTVGLGATISMAIQILMAAKF